MSIGAIGRRRREDSAMRTPHGSQRAWLAALVISSCGLGPAAASAADSQFDVKLAAGTILSLRRAADAIDTQYIAEGRRLGDVLLTYRSGDGPWQSASTSSLTAAENVADEVAPHSEARYLIDVDSAARLELTVRFVVEEEAVRWTLELRNLSDEPVEVGDLALPFPMNSAFGRRGRPPTAAVLKHSLIRILT